MCAGAIVLWRRNRLLLLLLVSPLLFTLAAAAMHRYPYGYSARLAQHMAATFCLLAGLGLAGAIRRLSPARVASEVLGTATVVLVAIGIVGIIRDVS